MKIKSKIQFLFNKIDKFFHNDSKFVGRIYLFLEKLSYKLSSHNSFLAAAGLAFNIFLYFIPLVLIGIFIANKLIEPKVIDSGIETIVLEFLPPTENTHVLLYELLNEVSNIQSGSFTSGLIGIFSLIWLSSLFVTALRGTLDKAAEIQSEKHFLFYKLKDLMLALFFPIIFMAYAIGLMGVTIIISYINTFVTVIHDSLLSEITINIFSLAFTFILFFLIYRYIPSQVIRGKITIVAALIGSILISVVRYLFAIYLSKFSNYSTFYGAYAAIISLAIWVYYLSAIIIIALEISFLILKKDSK